MCVYIYIYIYIYIYKCTCACVYIYIYIYIYTHTHCSPGQPQEEARPLLKPSGSCRSPGERIIIIAIITIITFIVIITIDEALRMLMAPEPRLSPRRPESSAARSPAPPDCSCRRSASVVFTYLFCHPVI